nr:GPP34 family phosphoprotein [Streptomyces sp. NBC_00974]
MTTAKDLFIIAMDPQAARSVGQGDLSLALAGAELIDLIGTGAVALDGDRIVPGTRPAQDDHLLDEAAAALTRQPPYERVEDWLWRRGRDLSAAYQRALEEDGQLTSERRGRLPFGASRMELVDSPARRQALSRLEADEPVIGALTAAVGIDRDRPADEPGLDGEPSPDDEAVTTVLAVVNDAVMELEAVRQRRSIEKAAFANVWRGP